MAPILAELKRRNVFKVATIYVVLSWLILQVATVVFPVFDIPDWASRLVVILLGLGFPVALVMAWAFDLTPDGIRRESGASERPVQTHAWDWVLGALLVVAIGLMVTSQIDVWQAASTPSSAPAATADSGLGSDDDTTVDVRRNLESIAVLPFDNLGADPGDDYIGDGLAEELLGVLGRIGELKVASRTSTAYYKNKDIDNATIAATLQVDNILSGSVRRVADRIRVTAVLDRSGTGQLLWTETYDRTLDDILDIQSEIAQSVAAAIVPVLSPESEQRIVARPTSSSEAYDYYLRGRDYLRQPTTEAILANATELFGRAIELDPRFAEAYAGKCDTNLRYYEFTRQSEYFERAEIFCHRALTLDGSLWEVRVALGNLYYMNGQYDRSVVELEAAVAQQPNAVNAHLSLAGVYAAQNRLVEAEQTFKRAEEVESGYWGVHRLFGHFYYDLSRYDDAIKRYKKVAELAPDNSVGYDNLGNTYLAIGELDLAEEALNAVTTPSRWTYTNRGLVYYYQGRFDKAVEDQLSAIDMAPDVHHGWGRLADAYRFLPGKDDEAQSAYRKAIKLAEEEIAINPSHWDSIARLAVYYAHTGRPDEARRQLGVLFSLTSDGTAYYFASITSLLLGDRDKTYEYLGESIGRGFARELIRSDPDLAPLRSDSRFDALLAPG